MKTATLALHSQRLVVLFVVCSILAASFAIAPKAEAQKAYIVGRNGTISYTPTEKATDAASVSTLESRLARIEALQKELAALIAQLKSEHGVSPRGTTTPQKKEFRLVHPNGGTVFKNRMSGDLQIKWIDTYNSESIDITLTDSKGATSSIVKGHKYSQGAVKGVASVSSKSVGGNSMRSSYESLSDLLKNRTPALGAPAAKPHLRSYTWKSPASGEDFKITIVGTVGTTTYSDTSDGTFDIKRAPSGACFDDVGTKVSCSEEKSLEVSTSNTPSTASLRR
jgi:hypothetical protein